MSFTTRCPACGTMFRVVSDQLKISDGWVRCGHCSDVFDATLYLDTWVAPATGTSPATEHGSGHDEATGDSLAVWSVDDVSPSVTTVVPPPAFKIPPPVEQAPPPQVADADTDITAASDAQEDVRDEDLDDGEGAWLSAPVPPDEGPDAHTLAVEALAEAERSPATAPADLDAVDEGARPPAALTEAAAAREGPVRSPAQEDDFQAELGRFAAGTSGVTSPLPLVAPESAEPARADAPAAPPEPVPRVAAEAGAGQASGLTDALPEPGFVRQARRRAFWRTPAVRAVLASLALLLLLLLTGQWALHERHQLAARHPELRPWLTQLCEPLGCRVEPARRIDDIVIDSTALVRRLGNFYSFDLVLKNTAPMDLAMPALELSLTDTRDAVIARRVFLPEELPGAPALLPAQDSVAISLRLSLAVGDALPMAGYRALVFYP